MTETAKPRILVLGSLNLDFVLDIERMPGAGETLTSKASALHCGGKGANQAVACARLGAEVAMIGRIGDDPAGTSLRDALAGENIAVDGIAVTPGCASGAAAVLLTPDGQNRIILAPGANARLTPEDVAAQADRFAAADLLVCQLETPLATIAAAIERAAAIGLPVLLNPAPAQPLPPALLARIDYLVPNESEATLLTGIAVDGPERAAEAAEQLRGHGIRCVVVTLGAAGILIADDRGARHVPALAADVVDTTAAGDCFIGGFATGLGEGLDIDAAAALGQRAARLCVGRPGAQVSLPWRREI
jgi:ribokinase